MINILGKKLYIQFYSIINIRNFKLAHCVLVKNLHRKILSNKNNILKLCKY